MHATDGYGTPVAMGLDIVQRKGPGGCRVPDLARRFYRGRNLLLHAADTQPAPHRSLGEERRGLAHGVPRCTVDTVRHLPVPRRRFVEPAAGYLHLRRLLLCQHINHDLYIHTADQHDVHHFHDVHDRPIPTLEGQPVRSPYHAPMTTLKPGDKTPAFTLLDQTGTKVEFSDFKGRSVLV